MAGKTDQMKGKAKEAAGVLTGDKDLESEGKADRRAGDAKEKVGHAKERSKSSLTRLSTRPER
jgi:uncharacterized protein YjbJ (UPF0337 family)